MAEDALAQFDRAAAVADAVIAATTRATAADRLAAFAGRKVA
ncbi:hypothetical protein GCM10023322_62590 [Rugosimonospora acidiphila]|uniref:Uncharacterized protein n=1 Tax=Rugosimonospora acidiphila TaxID=556531 RepID=A0ABP9SJ58_9ACTN